MALDTRRLRRTDLPDANISNTTLPGFAVMGVGLLVLIVGAILIAALGAPGADFNVNEEADKLAGPIVLCVGALLCLAGLIASLYLKNKGRQDSVVQPEVTVCPLSMLMTPA